MDNGSTYSISVENFTKTKNLISKNLGIYIMPPERSVDIDSAFQLEMARHFYKKIEK